MAVDVAQVLAQYEQAPATEPMHGQPGQIRRAPSTDQKRERREQNRKKAELMETDVPENLSVAELLRKAASAATLAEQQAYVAEAEKRTTAAVVRADKDRSLDLVNTHLASVLTPAPLHERTTPATDWLLDLAPKAASQQEAEHALIAEASLWFARIPEIVKGDADEFAEQASNKAHHVASQYGEHAPHAERAFLDEAARLHAQAVAGGLSVTASRKTAEQVDAPVLDDPEHWVGDTFKTEPREVPEPEHKDEVAPPASTPAPGGAPESVIPHEPREEHKEIPPTPHPIEQKLHEFRTGEDTAGVEAHSDAFVRSHLSGLARTASLTNTVIADELDKMAASTLDQVGGTEGMPVTTFPSYAPQTAAEPINTDSNRAPALQEIEGYQGWDGTSVVPQGDSGAAAANGVQGTRDASAQDQFGFPVSGSLHKESNMDQATCPTCGGHGHVAVRKLAYSGLPQIDQIVNADETPGTTPYPADVAFPLTGWDPGNVERVIQEAEGQIGSRPQGRPGAPGPAGGPGGSVAASRHQANGRDNSGWMGDNGAKGLDYPGYSTPVGYDGSSNLGEPDPVYGFGGDQTNAPKKPYGAQEAADFTNNPGQNWQPGQPTQDDQGWREVAMDPMVTSARLEIQRQQEIIEARAAAIRRQSGQHLANQYIKQQGGKWVILQKGTGKVLSHHDSQEKAEAAFRAMEWSKHGGD